MKHWWIYIVLYGAVCMFGLSPFAGTDVAMLDPVEVVWVEEKNGEICIETDCGTLGLGKTIQEALQNLHDTASGTVFLDTADYLLVKKGNEQFIIEMQTVLRPSCMVCIAERKPELSEAAEFLHTHKPVIRLKNVSDEMGALPLLDVQKGRLILVECENTDQTADGMADCSNQRPGT